MDDLTIRPFDYNDLNALIDIAELSFAEEMRAQGMTPQDFIRQVRTATRGRMIPFRILNRLTGTKWKLLVAEFEGEVVGCGSYIGRKQMELGNLMVHPDYRRRGIGQLLLERRLEYLAREGHEHVTTTVLATNEASLGNLRKQSFEPFDRYTVFKSTLPLTQPAADGQAKLKVRPVRADDQTRFETLEKQTTKPELLNIQGSRWTDYAPSSSAGRLTDKLWGASHWHRAFERNGTVIGFLSGRVSNNSPTGIIMRPLVPDKHLNYLAAMFWEAASWMDDLGKKSVQTAASETRPALSQILEDTGWSQTHTWIRLVKWLDEEDGATERVS